MKPRPKRQGPIGTTERAAAQRRPALGGALQPSKGDSNTSQEVIYEYSQQMNQQVVALESENVELSDAKRALEARVTELNQRVAELERESRELRDAGMATMQERNLTVNHTNDALRAKQGEVMLLRNTADHHQHRENVLATQNARLSGIAERLQAERSQLQKTVVGLEATACAMQVEISRQANSEAQAALVHGDMERQISSLSMQKMRLDEEMGVRHVEAAHLRHTHQELLSERQLVQHLREELEEALHGHQRMQDHAAGLSQTVSALHIEVAHFRNLEEAAAAEAPRWQEAVHREAALAGSLRTRLAELEDLVGDLRRAHTALDGENGSLRSQLARSQAEVESCLNASSQLVMEKGGVEKLADEKSSHCVQLEHRIGLLNAEVSRLRAHNETLNADNLQFRSRAENLEAETVMLRGRVNGLESVVRGLKGECSDLNLRNLHAADVDIGRGLVRAWSPAPNKALASSPEPQKRLALPSPDQLPPDTVARLQAAAKQPPRTQLQAPMPPGPPAAAPSATLHGLYAHGSPLAIEDPRMSPMRQPFR